MIGVLWSPQNNDGHPINPECCAAVGQFAGVQSNSCRGHGILKTAGHACQRPSGGDSRGRLGCFLVDLFALAGDASSSISNMFTLNKPTGGLSGVTTTAKIRSMPHPYAFHLERSCSDRPRRHIQFVKALPPVSRCRAQPADEEDADDDVAEQPKILVETAHRNPYRPFKVQFVG